MRKSSKVEYKFILGKIQELVCDSRGRLTYIDDFDHVIDDVFGIRHLARNINDSYDDRDVIAAIDKIGLSYLVEIFDSRQIFDIMKDLVAVSNRLRELQKCIRKSAKKGTRRKGDLKEFKYLRRLYEDSIKYLRKRMHLDGRKTLYKKKYRTLTSVLDRQEWGLDDDNGFSSLLDDDWGFDDEYDDWDEQSELEDFRAQLDGRFQNRGSRRRDNMDFSMDEEDDGMYELYDRVENLTDTVAHMSAALQAMSAKNQFDAAASRRRQSYSIPRPTPVSAPVSPINPSGNAEIDDLRKTNGYIMQQLGSLAEGQAAINQFLEEIVSDGSDTVGEDDEFDDFTQRDAVARYNQDPHDMDSSDLMNREDLIDMINNSQPEPTPQIKGSTQPSQVQ